MPPVNYRVTEPGVVKDEFRRILARAEAEGRLAAVVGAARYMLDELAYDPAHFGEARDRLYAMKLDRRIAFVIPLVVEFAVNESAKEVFVRRVGLLG